MTKLYIEEKEFDGSDFKETALTKGDYERCTFTNCNFASADLSHISFEECEFQDCDLSLAAITDTAFKNVRFTSCKMLGLRFDTCNKFLFEIHCDNCNLDLVSFYQLKNKGIRLRNCSLHETDFTEADLTGATFSDCDLAGAMFENTNLEKADLRTASNFSIDPETNRIKKAKFSLAGLKGLVDKYDIEVE